MSEKKQYIKREYIRLLNAELNENSSEKDSALQSLKAEGINTDKLISDGVKRIKRMQLEIAAQKTRIEMKVAEKFREKAIELAKKTFSEISFSIGEFMIREKLAVNFRNFESLSQEDIKELLIKHYTIKLMEENADYDEDI
jgi:hypothetical protein